MTHLNPVDRALDVPHPSQQTISLQEVGKGTTQLLSSFITGVDAVESVSPELCCLLCDGS